MIQHVKYKKKIFSFSMNFIVVTRECFSRKFFSIRESLSRKKKL